MRLRDLLDGVDVAEWIGDGNVVIDSVADDSRRVEPGDLFCCIRGANTDGHDHASAAIRQGAVALLVEQRLAQDVPQARVGDVRLAIGPVAAAAAGHPSRSLALFGITGTNGKTTTAFLFESISRAAGDSSAVLGTLTAGTAHTTPEAPELQGQIAALADRGVETVAMEVSSHALAQHRVDGTWFRAVCFTNLGHDHLDFHGDLDAYFEAKARLFTTEFSDRCVVNLSDPVGARLADRARSAGLEVRTFGVDRHDVDVAVVVEATARASTMVRLATPDGEARLELPLIGGFNVANAAAAAALAWTGGSEPAAIAEGLRTASAVPGRMELVRCGQPFAVIFDYAHTPDALSRVLEVARGLTDPTGRVAVVFGCGGDRDRTKRFEMGRVAGEGADVVVITSDNSRSEDPGAIAAAVARGLATTSTSGSIELDRARAIERGLVAAQPGDVVVIAGKGHEETQTTGAMVVPFDDRVVARAVLESCSWT